MEFFGDEALILTKFSGVNKESYLFTKFFIGRPWMSSMVNAILLNSSVARSPHPGLGGGWGSIKMQQPNIK